MNAPHKPCVLCVGCEKAEVGVLDLLCPACHQLAIRVGFIPKPADAPDQRIQIGPTDV